MITALKRLFKEDWIKSLNVEDFLGHFHKEDMEPEVQAKWIEMENSTNNPDLKNHFIFMTDDSMIAKFEENPMIIFADASHKVSLTSSQMNL